jgi:lauroyl/myristoyl acyltransferase
MPALRRGDGAVPAGAQALAARADRVGARAPNLATAPTTLAGVRQMLRALKAGGAVGLLPDQVPPQGWACGRRSSARPAYTMTLPARLVQQTGAVLLLIWGERLPGGRGYRVRVSSVGRRLGRRRRKPPRRRSMRRWSAWCATAQPVPVGLCALQAAAPGAGAVISRLGVRFMHFLARLPLRWVRAPRPRLGVLLYWLVWPRRHVVNVNLRLCFPAVDADAAAPARVRASVFILVAQSWLDRGWLWHAIPRWCGGGCVVTGASANSPAAIPPSCSRRTSSASTPA